MPNLDASENLLRTAPRRALTRRSATGFAVVRPQSKFRLGSRLRSDGLQTRCRELAAPTDDVIAHFLHLIEGAHSGTFHRRDIDEHFLVAAGRLDGAEAFLGIEKLDRSILARPAAALSPTRPFRRADGWIHA